MTEKQEKIPSKYLDRRVVERYMKKGLVDEKEYLRQLKALPDLAEKASTLDTHFEDDDVR